MNKQSYIDGYRNGRNDKRLGRSLIVARYSKDPYYRIGYNDGQNDAISLARTILGDDVSRLEENE